MTKTTFRHSFCPVLALSIALALAGCAVGPDYKRPQAPEAKEYAPTPIARDTASASASLAESALALRTMADAGLFSSCARPADNLPSDTNFSS